MKFCYHVILSKFDKENNNEITIEQLDSSLHNMKDLLHYAFILHDNDGDYIHFHIILIFSKELKKVVLIKRISSLLWCSDNCITISFIPLENLCDNFLYLIHYNNLEKSSYLFTSVHTDLLDLMDFYSDMVYLGESSLLSDLFKQYSLKDLLNYANEFNGSWSSFVLSLNDEALQLLRSNLNMIYYFFKSSKGVSI